MRILIGADSYPPDINGAAGFAGRLAHGLAGRGHEVHVVCASTDGPAALRRDGPVTLHRMPSIRYRWHESLRVCLPWQLQPASRRLIAAVRPDLVHVQSHMVIGRGLACAADRAGVALVATNHFMPENVFGYVPLLSRRLYGPAGRLAWRDLAGIFGRADQVTAPTPRAVQLLTAATGLAAEAVSCGIELERYGRGAEAVPSAEPPVVLFVGRLDREKRVDELVTAFARLPPAVGARLEIVGAGEQHASLVRLAARLGVAGSVTFRGHISQDELLAAYGRAAVFCMPGVAELQSLVMLEAMAAGRPVVAADAMALPHLVEPGRNGWLYQPGNIGELAMRLSTLIADPQLRRRMGRRSREIVAGHDFAATLDRFEQIYSTVTERRRSPSPARSAAPAA